MSTNSLRESQEESQTNIRLEYQAIVTHWGRSLFRYAQESDSKVSYYQTRRFTSYLSYIIIYRPA